MSGVQAPNLVGSYWVTPTATALNRAWKLFKGRLSPYFELRRHALKLAFFPTGRRDSDGMVLDLDWSSITGTGHRDIGELRITDVIGGYDNLRIVFFVADSVIPGERLPRIWVLTVFRKKNERFSANELKSFSARRQLIIERNYKRG